MEAENLMQNQKNLKNEIERLNSDLYDREENIKRLTKENEQLKYAVKINKVYFIFDKRKFM